MVEYPCIYCKRDVILDCIECSLCKKWAHRVCAKLSKKQLCKLEGDDHYWFCDNCVECFPFRDLMDDEFLYINDLAFDNLNLYELNEECKEYEFGEYSTFSDNRYGLGGIDPDNNFYGNHNYSCNYFTHDKFVHTVKSSQGLSILQLNCRSLVANFYEMSAFIQGLEIEFDFITISESWFNASTDVNDFQLSDYDIFVRNRVNKRGGGVVIYSNSKYGVTICDRLSCTIDNMFECLTVEAEVTNSNNILVMCIYRAPGTCLASFNENISNLIARVNPKKKLFVCGDFNIDILKVDSNADSLCFLDIMYGYGLYPLITKPTRITTTSATLIDNIYTNVLADTKNGIIVSDFISDHMPIFTTVNLKCKASVKSKVYKQSRVFTPDILLSIGDSLLECDWSEVYNDGNANNAYTQFINIVKNKCDLLCPMQRVEVKGVNECKPWLTKALKKACRRKNRLYYKFIDNRTNVNECKYKAYKNKLTAILRLAEKRYYSELLASHRHDVRKTWKVLNEVIKKRKSNTKVHDVFTDSLGNSVNNKDQVSRLFNDFFVNIGPKLADQIHSDCNATVEGYLGEPSVASMFLRAVDKTELLDIVSHCTSKTSLDPDGLDMSTIKELFPAIVMPFLHICNLSLSSGIFPDFMKIAKVIPLFKAGKKDSVSNYRPVSLLPQFSKILEKVYYRRLEEFLDKGNTISDCQYGFRKKCSTSLALIDFTDNIVSAMDRNEYTLGVFIDLKKAFDTVNHDILLKKLYHVGVRGIAYDWLASYLSSRKQFVYYNGSKSDVRSIRTGVPQGSILAPLLFLIYINDLTKVSSLIKVILFADDTNLYMSGHNLQHLVEVFNSELCKLESWFKVNKLSLNVSKTNFMLFGKKRETLPIVLKLCGLEITRVFVTKFLGVLIDQNLNWKDHIRALGTKLSKCISIIYKASIVLDSSALRLLYCTLFLPYITYCAEIWGTGYKSNIQSIVLYQKKVIRIVCKGGRIDHTSPMFKSLKVLKFIDIVKLKICTIMYNSLKGLLPKQVQSKIGFFNSCKRNHRVFSIPFTRTTIRSQCALVIGPKLYHDLPVEIVLSKTLFTFKNKLKKNIIHMY